MRVCGWERISGKWGHGGVSRGSCGFLGPSQTICLDNIFSQTLYEQARVLGCWQLLSNQKTAQGATKYVACSQMMQPFACVGACTWKEASLLQTRGLL